MVEILEKIEVQTQRIDVIEAENRLKDFPNLFAILGNEWITEEYEKSTNHWSVITGWVSGRDYFFRPWLKDLDNALGFLKICTRSDVWEIIMRKVHAHANRSNSHGTLAELAIGRFLAENGIAFDLETNLNSDNNKDVDISAFIGENQVHIEVQSLLYSDKSNIAATVAADYHASYGVNLENEVFRVKRKIYQKALKFTKSDITLVAIRSLELGLDEGFWAIEKAVTEVFGKQCQQDERDKTINRFVDGVIWFELESGNNLSPRKRKIHLNPKSPHYDNPSILEFRKLWVK